jgi:16S rRNA (cytosine967-C5)-methyltransferase
VDARAAAVEVLLQVVERGRTLGDALAEHQQELSDSRDRALLQELCFGTLRWQLQLRALLGQLLSRPLKDLDLDLLLSLGLYQLLHTRIPPHAALAATVEVARGRGKPWAAGLVNGVLRSFLRQREALLRHVSADPQARWSLPGWLLDALRQAWPEQWPSLAAGLNERPPLSLRVNQRRLSRDAYLERLREQGLDAVPIPHVATGLVLNTPRDTRALPGFAEGLVSVQDGGAQLAAALLDVAPGQRVLDACAAPGGKTCHLLETVAQGLRLTAVDLDAVRLDRVRENLQRLGLEAELSVGNAAAPAGAWGERHYERILLDVPCSATGVIRRHPDIKVLRRPSDIGPMSVLQGQMLDALWQRLTPAGRLLYVTCSVLPEENERQVLAFLERQPDARERPIAAPWGQPRAVGRQILPGAGGMDGFYYACLEKEPCHGT